MSNLLNKILPSSNSRMKITIGCLIANYIIIMIGIFEGVDLSDLGIGLAALNAPLYVYVYGQSVRPSRLENTAEENNNLNNKQ